MGRFRGYVGQRLDVWRSERSTAQEDSFRGVGVDSWNGLDELPRKVGLSLYDL